jgi:hypothetical protein
MHKARPGASSLVDKRSRWECCLISRGEPAGRSPLFELHGAGFANGLLPKRSVPLQRPSPFEERRDLSEGVEVELASEHPDRPVEGRGNAVATLREWRLA